VRQRFLWHRKADTLWRVRRKEEKACILNAALDPKLTTRRHCLPTQRALNRVSLERIQLSS